MYCYSLHSSYTKCVKSKQTKLSKMKPVGRSTNVYKRALASSLKQWVQNSLMVGNTGIKLPSPIKTILINVQENYLAQLAGRAAA